MRTSPRNPQQMGKKAYREGLKPDAAETISYPHRWGGVLAGGDGVRLRELTRLIVGDDRPKQFCPLFGECTLLAQARQRAERSIGSERILFALTGAHQDYYLEDLGDCPSQRVVQPRNKGTAHV